MLPERNMRHLILSDEVVAAVASGQFHIATMNNVAEGILHLTDHTLAEVNAVAEVTLRSFKSILELNLPKNISL